MNPYLPTAVEWSDGSIDRRNPVVALAQPLGRLGFYLLEPRADDGLTNWGLLDAFLEDGEYPIFRIR